MSVFTAPQSGRVRDPSPARYILDDLDRELREKYLEYFYQPFGAARRTGQKRGQRHQPVRSYRKSISQLRINTGQTQQLKRSGAETRRCRMRNRTVFLPAAIKKGVEPMIEDIEKIPERTFSVSLIEQ